ncbi:hypothetical protein L1049_022922 [Liquidambar formosana]|uniref:NAC domain-containing protein n=1 Tax=Liquidambar formosana TaxID=63359 RepID=A0AAP0RDA0_LIQFO
MSNLESSKDDEVQLPGFRFYPTDEELVGFYLRRKVEKKPTSIELIKQMDIYKYDPWDLPKVGTVGDKEWYFFCKRGRKYRNSIRPNRVTGSGFWKATGIDKPVYSVEGEGRDCIGLKKSLVYYRGSAGKGTKTDWMMHEFRQPADDNKNTNLPNAKCTTQEAEVWTVCRIFKRDPSHKKYTPNWREILAKRDSTASSSSISCSMESDNREGGYISFAAPVVCQKEKKPPIVGHMGERTNQFAVENSSPVITQPPLMATSSSVLNGDVNEFLTYENWDELRSVVEFAGDPFPS